MVLLCRLQLHKHALALAFSNDFDQSIWRRSFWYHSKINQNWAATWKTTTTKWVCAQRRLRSSWGSAQSDQSLRCALIGWLRAQCFFIRTAKTLISHIFGFVMSRLRCLDSLPINQLFIFTIHFSFFFFFVEDTIMLGLSSIVYESKLITMNIWTDLQLPNVFQHLSSLVWLMQNPLPRKRFAFYRISLNIGCWLIETSSSK